MEKKHEKRDKGMKERRGIKMTEGQGSEESGEKEGKEREKRKGKAEGREGRVVWCGENSEERRGENKGVREGVNDIEDRVEERWKGDTGREER